MQPLKQTCSGKASTFWSSCVCTPTPVRVTCTVGAPGHRMRVGRLPGTRHARRWRCLQSHHGKIDVLLFCLERIQISILLSHQFHASKILLPFFVATTQTGQDKVKPLKSRVFLSKGSMAEPLDAAPPPSCSAWRNCSDWHLTVPQRDLKLATYETQQRLPRKFPRGRHLKLLLDLI